MIPSIQELPKLVSKYRIPNNKKALIQMITSFWPFFLLMSFMYLVIYFQSLPNRLIIPLSIINGFFLVRIFIIQHDCWHQSFFQNKKLNTIVWNICSYFSLIPYSYWAKSHNFHHNHNSKLRKYRDIGDIFTYTVDEFKKLSSWWKLKYKAFRNPFVMFWLGPTWYVLLQNRLPTIHLEWRSKERKESIINNIGIVWVYITLWMLFWRKTLLFAHLPVIMCFATVAIWFFYVQHQHELTYKSREEKWDYVTAAIQWSSFYDLPKRMHRFTGNIWYHHIHHLNASIPNYQLVKCFNENEILQSSVHKLTFKKSLECLWCHLRDENQQKMISFREFRKKYSKS